MTGGRTTSNTTGNMTTLTARGENAGAGAPLPPVFTKTNVTTIRRRGVVTVVVRAGAGAQATPRPATTPTTTPPERGATTVRPEVDTTTMVMIQTDVAGAKILEFFEVANRLKTSAPLATTEARAATTDAPKIGSTAARVLKRSILQTGLSKNTKIQTALLPPKTPDDTTTTAATKFTNMELLPMQAQRTA